MNTLLSSTHQIKRIILWLGIALILVTVTFTGYYYYDRYYTTEVPVIEQMISEVEQAVRDNPNDPEARLKLAETYMLNGKFADAIPQILQVKESYPDNLQADFLLGVSYASSGKPQQAIEPLQKFIASQEDSSMLALNKPFLAALYYLGDSYLQLGQPQEAIAPLERNVGLSQIDADAMYKLGMAYAGTGEHFGAVVMFHTATAYVPNFTEAYEAMALSYEANGQQSYANYARGMAAYSRQDYKKALDLLLQFAQAQPDFAPAFAGLGMTYEALGDLQNAKSSYDTAVLLDPGNYAASRGAQRVEAALKK